MSIQNEILNAIAARRSCRAYKPEQITAEELEAVQALLARLGVETALPEPPWTEPCAVVLLPAEELPSSPEEPAN